MGVGCRNIHWSKVSGGRTLQSESDEPKLVRDDEEVELNLQEQQEIERECCDRQSIPICNCPLDRKNVTFFGPVVKYFEKNLVKIATSCVV